MAKPRTRETAPPAAPEESSAAEAPAGYRITQWAGQDNFECEHCPYATLDLERIQRHVAQAHA